jgi:zinc protease
VPTTPTMPNLSRGRALALLSALALALPGAGAQPAKQPPLDRSQRPAAPPPPAFTFPAITRRTLPNGLEVAVVENHELPVVAVRVVTEGGGFVDPVGKEGVFQLVTGMLREGTTTMSADQLAEAFADLGNSVSPGGFTTITRNLDRSLELMGEMLMHPAFPQAALDRQKANLAANLQRAREQPGFVAQRIFSNVVYGAGHPYERAASDRSVAAITRDDLVAFHEAYVRPQNVKLVVVGDVTAATVLPRVERALGQWAQGGTTVSYEVPPPKGAGKTTIYLFDRPNSPQSVVTMGQIGPSRASEDFYALEVMNTVLGQLSGSRLSQNLREKRAFTYGINSFWQWRRAPEVATFTGSSSIVAAKTDSALMAWMQELRGIRGERPVTDRELDFARTNRVAGMPATMESNDQVADAVANLLRNNLPPDYYQQYARRVSTITGADVASVATKYVDPENTAIVIVGDRKVIEPGLRAANIAPIVIVDENGKTLSN